ncbi:hypothetical protein BGL67_00385 [Helicobacter pylori]|nr:hypothetical protein [Helicobacter pylori]OPG37615.1 hypothetical protein BGL67_00385 [Helicobacter pylori]RVZ80906.1 hypothetical protein EC591_02005 [Helicobacter pylori]
MNGEFWRKGFIFNTNAFFAGKNHQTNSSFTCQYPFIIAYKSGVMLDKVTKACCSRDPFLAPCMLIFVRFFTKATLKRVAVQSIF